MAQVPRYERQVGYQALPADSSRSLASRELAQGLGQLSGQLLDIAAQQSAAKGAEEGAMAGGKGKPEKAQEWTAYGRSFNQAAMQSYRAKLDADMRQTLADLADENRNDSESFNAKSGEYLSGLIKDIDPAIEQDVRNDFNLRTQAYRQRIIEGERQRAALEMKGSLEEDTRNLTDSLYRSARDGMADIVAADRLKLEQRINADTISDKNPDGLIAPAEASRMLANIDEDVKVEYTFGDFMRTLQNDGVDAAKGVLSNFSKSRLKDLGINPDKRDALVHKMEAEIRGAESVAANKDSVNKALFGQRVQDEVAMHRDGVEPPHPLSLADFVSTYGADEGAFRFNELQSERAYGQAVKQVIGASPQEQAAMLGKMAPVPGEGYEVQSKRYDQMRAAIQQVNAAREKDPATYALRESGVEDATPEQQVIAGLATQRRWGIQNTKPLPNNQASIMVREFSTKPGPEAAAQFASLKQTYGKAYPEVYAQLVEEGLPPAFVAIGAGMAPGPASLLAEVANVDIKELKDSLPATVSPKDISMAIATQAEEFNQSLVGMPGSENTYSSMAEAANRLAYRYVRQNGESASSAAQKAWNDALGSRYEFKTFNGGTARIPNNQPVEAIEDSFEPMLEKITPAMIDAPAFAGPGYTPEQLKATLKSRAYFVTTEQEDGAYLFMDGRPVPGKGGTLVKFTWKQLLERSASHLDAQPIKQLTTGAY